jgi:hypothetical protein
LISLRVLNSAFADARDQAILSYAESNSLIGFIIDEYGADKLAELIAIFAEGAHYDDAMLEVFGVDMDGMEDLWRAHIGAQPRTGETRATPVPSPTAAQVAENTPTAIRTPEATATGTAIVAVSTPTATPIPQQVATPTATPVPRSAGPCLGAIPALALVALFAVFSPRRTR